MSRVPLLPNPVGQELVGLASPPDWAEVFGRGGPLELEIGCGAGGFALDYVRQFPQVRYVALERRKKFARDCSRPVPWRRSTSTFPTPGGSAPTKSGLCLLPNSAGSSSNCWLKGASSISAPTSRNERRKCSKPSNM